VAGAVEFKFGLDDFFARLKQAAGGDFKKELESFMQGLGTEFLRIVEDEIIRRKVMDTRLLLASFHEGGDESVWETSEAGLTLEVGTNVKYAAYVNDGHWTNPKGVESRFVPGSWEGDRFIYDSGAKTGMILKQKWVEGAHYWEAAIRIFEKLFPDILEAKLQQWLNSYFSDFI
jgi:hypothetical protein